MTKSCKNCHFLAKSRYEDPDELLDLPHGESPGWGSYTWDRYDRADLSAGTTSYGEWVAECWKGVWSKRIDSSLKEKDLLLQDRGDDCFFIEVHEGMSFEAAEELFRQRNDNRQLKTSYRYTQWGLWIAVITGVLSFFLGLFDSLRSN